MGGDGWRFLSVTQTFSAMKVPHIVCQELLLISFPLLAIAEVVRRATLIPIGQRALQREGRGGQRGETGRCAWGHEGERTREGERSEEQGSEDGGGEET